MNRSMIVITAVALVIIGVVVGAIVYKRRSIRRRERTLKLTAEVNGPRVNDDDDEVSDAMTSRLR